MYKLVIPSILALQGKARGFRSGKGGRGRRCGGEPRSAGSMTGVRPPTSSGYRLSKRRGPVHVKGGGPTFNSNFVLHRANVIFRRKGRGPGPLDHPPKSAPVLQPLPLAKQGDLIPNLGTLINGILRKTRSSVIFSFSSSEDNAICH